MDEMWKPLIYNGENIDRLLISNIGRVKNKRTGKILKQHVNKKGYCTIVVSIGVRNTKINVKVHRAVAETFIPNPKSLPMVNHKDCNKLNNSVANLEWCTNKDNIDHAIKNGLINPYINSKNRQIMSLENKKKYISIAAAGREYSNDSLKVDSARKNISRALAHGGTAYGMTWVYVDDVSA